MTPPSEAPGKQGAEKKLEAVQNKLCGAILPGLGPCIKDKGHEGPHQLNTVAGGPELLICPDYDIRTGNQCLLPYRHSGQHRRKEHTYTQSEVDRIVQQELAAAESLFVKILDGELPPMAANDCDGVADALARHDTKLTMRFVDSIIKGEHGLVSRDTVQDLLAIATTLASSAANSPEPRT